MKYSTRAVYPHIYIYIYILWARTTSFRHPFTRSEGERYLLCDIFIIHGVITYTQQHEKYLIEDAIWLSC